MKIGEWSKTIFGFAMGVMIVLSLNSIPTSRAQDYQWSALYGPFANKDYLRKDIIEYFKKQIDAKRYTLTDDDIELGLTAEGEKAEAKAYVQQPNALFEPKDFTKLSGRITEELNKWLGREIFTPSDFMPRDEDFPKDRNVDPQGLLNIANKNKWMTISEYIDKVFLRATARAKDMLEARMKKYIEDYNANKKRQ
jgi:hypothetical protein